MTAEFSHGDRVELLTIIVRRPGGLAIIERKTIKATVLAWLEIAGPGLNFGAYQIITDGSLVETTCLPEELRPMNALERLAEET
jgi:hypothetical protein